MFPFLGIEPLMFPKAPNVFKIFLALVETLGVHWCILYGYTIFILSVRIF